MANNKHKWERGQNLHEILKQDGFIYARIPANTEEADDDNDLLIVVSGETGDVTLTVGSSGEIFRFPSSRSLDRMQALFQTASENLKAIRRNSHG